MKKKSIEKLVIYLIVFAMIVTYFNVGAFATCAEGKSGISWSYDDSSKTLTVSGTGKIPDYGIDDSPFADIKHSIKHVKIEEGITEMGNSCLCGMEKCVSLVLPESLFTIGDYGAADMAIESLYIPKGVCNIGLGLTHKCNNLDFLDVDSENPVFYSKSNCLIRKDEMWLEAATRNSIIPNGVTRIRSCAFSQIDIPDIVAIPDSVETIEFAAFEFCHIKTLIIGSGVNKVDDISFSGTRFDQINVSEQNTYMTLKDHCLIIDDKDVIAYEYYGNKDEGVEINVPEGVTTISVAPSSKMNVSRLTLPSSIKEICRCAFYVNYNIDELCIYSKNAPKLNANSLYDCEFINGIHVLKNAIGYDTAPWNEYNIIYDLGNDIPEPEPITSKYTLDDLYFSFYNSSSSFGYSYDYRIPLSAYKIWYSEAEAKLLYENSSTWRGSCYGMSALSEMLNESDASGISPSIFGNDKKKVSQLKTKNVCNTLGANTTLTSFIEAIQVSQTKEEIQQNYKSSSQELTSASKKALSELKKHHTNPYLISLFWIGGGHAVVAYDIKEISEKEDHLLIYDPNYSNNSRYITLNKDNQGNYIGWTYFVNDRVECSSRMSGSRIGFIDYQTINNIWMTRRNHSSSNVVAIAAKAEVEIKDKSNNLLATIHNGELTCFSDKIIPIQQLESEKSSSSILFYLKEENDVKISAIESTNIDMSIAHEYESTSVNVQAPEGSSINLEIQNDFVDSISLSDAIKEYAVTFYKNGKIVSTSTNKSGSTDNNNTSNNNGNSSTISDKNSKQNNVQTSTIKTKKITVPSTKINTVKVNKNNVLLKWKKQPKVKGYQVQIAQNKKMTKSRWTIVTKNSSFVFKSLRKNKVYYVRVRAYTLDSKGKKIYGKWSNVKKVKTKK